MKIRKATKKDFEDYLRLKIEDVTAYSKIIKRKLKIPSKEFVKKEFNESIENKNSIILFVEEREVFGYLAGNFLKNSWNNFGYIGDIFIVSNLRKKGLGTKLMREFERICKKKNLEEIRLDVSIKNKEAISLYKKEKFEIIKYNLRKRLK